LRSPLAKYEETPIILSSFIPTYRERIYTPFENPIDISVIRPLWKRGGRGDLIQYLILGNEEQPMVAPAISTL
jgi:hypothetical protein